VALHRTRADSEVEVLGPSGGARVTGDQKFGGDEPRETAPRNRIDVRDLLETTGLTEAWTGFNDQKIRAEDRGREMG